MHENFRFKSQPSHFPYIVGHSLSVRNAVIVLPAMVISNKSAAYVYGYGTCQLVLLTNVGHSILV